MRRRPALSEESIESNTYRLYRFDSWIFPTKSGTADDASCAEATKRPAVGSISSVTAIPSPALSDWDTTAPFPFKILLGRCLYNLPHTVDWRFPVKTPEALTHSGFKFPSHFFL